MEDPLVRPELNPTTATLQGDEYLPLSGKPYSNIILAKSHVRPHYKMTVPATLYRLLPCKVIPVVLTYGGKNWDMLYEGRHRTVKRFDSGWKEFANDNDLKAGDACVFELIEVSHTKLLIRTRILRGEIPSEFLDKVRSKGDSFDDPIIIE